MKVKFHIELVGAVSINSHWDRACDVSRVAPVARRRLSDAAKMAFDLTSYKRLCMPIVFSSHIGELSRCLDMLERLHSEVSPTSFSLSVLNAIPAMLAIDAGSHAPIMAISARSSVENGILSSLSHDQAFLISYFEGARKNYISDEPFCIAVGAIITRNLDKISLQDINNPNGIYELSFSANVQKPHVSEEIFLQNFGVSDRWSSFDGELEWLWQKLS